MSLNTKNNIAARMGFDVVRQTIHDAWIKNFGNNEREAWAYVDSLKLAPNTVRLEVKLAANASVYTFGVTPQQANNDGIVYKTEQRLNQTDTLIVTSYALMVALPLDGTQNAVNFRPKTYANPVEFGADADLINNIVFGNGIKKLTVNNDVLIPAADLLQNLYIPETQATAAPGAGSPLDEITGANDGFVAVEPNIYLVGPRNSVPQVILPTSIAALATANARLVLIYRGYLAQNSTVMA